MKKKLLAGLAAGLFISGMGGMASAGTTVEFVSEEVTDIGPSTTYEFTLQGLVSPDQFLGGALFIEETNADFNNDFDTVAVNIDGIGFGGHFFKDDNGDIERTLMLTVPLGYSDLFYITQDGEATITLTTSDTVGTGVASSLPNSMFVFLGYEGADNPTRTGCNQSDLTGTWKTYGVSGDTFNGKMNETDRCKITINSSGGIVGSSSACKFRDKTGVHKLDVVKGNMEINKHCVVTGFLRLCSGDECVKQIIEHGTLSTEKDVLSILGYSKSDPDAVFSMTGLRR
ncbi:MAG: hypothetical protein ABFS24_02515 [Pseudomonadota bacterium]